MNGGTGDERVGRLQLTADGVSSDPIALATPEPGSLAVMALAMAVFAVHRIRERRAARDRL
jgi:hypothetical protein